MEKSEKHKILNALLIPVLLTLICWIVWFIDNDQHLNFYKYGVFPREIFGLKGIILGPLVHSTKDMAHIINNSMPLFVLSWALYYFYQEIATRILILIWIITGTWVWVGANQAYHIGISGVLYGLVTFLFFSGIIRKNKNLMGLTLLVTFLYGGMVWGVLPYDISISWESHLFGAVAGIVLAYYFRKSGPQRDYKEWPKEEEPPFLLTPEGEKDYEYWKTEEQRLKEQKENSASNETEVNYIYKEKE